MDLWKTPLRTALEEDGWQWDWTTIGTVARPDERLRAKVVAKSEGVWAAEGLCVSAEKLASELGFSLRIKCLARDGDRLRKGQVVTEWEGDARVLLALERPFLNLASFVGGIATRTRAFVDAVARAKLESPPRITPTRKTLPGYRDLSVHGIRVGGGFSHRVSLSGGVLIKENHIEAAGGIRRAVEGARGVAPHGLKIEIEVKSLDELKQAIDAGADGVLLDNFTPELVGKALEAIRKAGATGLVVEVSGGVTEQNIGEFARPGVHVISSGSLTLSVVSLDLSLLVE